MSNQIITKCMSNKVHNFLISKNYMRGHIYIQKNKYLTFKLYSYLKFLAITLDLIEFLFNYLFLVVF